MRRSIFACGLLLALAGIPSALAAVGGENGLQTAAAPNAARHQAVTPAEERSIEHWSAKARRAQAATVRWLTVIRGRPPQHVTIMRGTPTAHSARSLALLWHRRAVAAWRTAQHPPQLRAWHCIHSYEGSWADPDAPYWGGLQMDYSFQSAYGPWLLRHQGTANHWTPLEQIWTGVRAWRVRGFQPWSTTARACGVL
jgi:hypothetical protein